MEDAVSEENDHAIINLIPEEIDVHNHMPSDTDENNEKYNEIMPSDETEKLVNDADVIDVDNVKTEDADILSDGNQITDVTKDIIIIESNEIIENYDSTEVHDESTKRKCSCCMCVCCRKKPNRNRNVSEKVKIRSKRRNMRDDKCDRCRYCCKRFLAFLFSHIGLCSLVVAYAILGGFIFKEIEAPEEAIIRNDVEAKRKTQVDRLWNLTRVKNIFHPVNWTIMAEAILIEFQTQIYTATKERGWDGKKEDGDPQWTFAGSLLYSITVITTIGYGNIAPKTNIGRLITMAYAIVGIPLTLLCLANLGSMMGNCFRFLYKHFCKMIICLCCPTQAQWFAKRQSKNFPNIPSGMHSMNKKHPGSKESTLKKGEISNAHGGKEEPVRVPILVSLMLIASYIVAGAVIFASWEDWDLIIGSYFCFITLSTIGFGDFVPGSNSYSFDNQEKMVICCLYLIFGLSMIAMCFNLMQEEVRAKFRWLGQKLGIVEENK